MLPSMLKTLSAAVVLSALAVPSLAFAQEAAKPAPAPLSASTGIKNLYGTVRGYIVAAAEAMPEEHFAFKPTRDVRSFGELLGHIANANYNFCAAPKKTTNPNKSNFEKTATTKAAIITAVKESFAFCDSAYEVADAGLTEMIKMGQREVGAAYPLTFNVAHNFEHYGNIVTYMRLKGLVPPSSAPR